MQKKTTLIGMSINSQSNMNESAAPSLVALCAGILPVWARHLAASRAQSEVAVTQMLQAFADIGPHINMAERQSQQITDALSQSDGGVTGLTQACERVLGPLLSGSQLPPGAHEAIEQVLVMVRTAVTALEQIPKPFTHETQMVAEQVERMYVGFQYQDRISQMMALLENDIARLQSAIEGKSAELPELDAWLAQLESLYAMEEQRQNHSGNVTGGADDKETTFF
jgi:ABC-type transporter Mla subunit MlaD